MRFFKKLFWSTTKRLRIKYVVLLLFGSESFLRQWGWFKSANIRLAIDGQGKPLPWYPYCAAYFLGPRLNRDMEVFEYGCGYSTLWYAERVKTVDCVESSEGWMKKVQAMAGDKVSIRFAPQHDEQTYTTMIDQFNKQYDVIVIDGYNRLACARHCVPRLKPGGVIVFDNTDWCVEGAVPEWETYRDAVKAIMDQGYKRLQFMGMGAKTERGWETSIFYKDGNVLDI